MNIPQEAVELIKTSEGLSLVAYLDPVEVWTIGYGHTGGVKSGAKITQAQADAYLKQDMQFAIDAVAQLVEVVLTPSQAGALVSFVFNVGRNAFAGSMLLVKVNRRDWTGAAAEFARWVHGERGEILPGLVARRKAEAQIFLKGVATPAGVGPAGRIVVQAQSTDISCGQCSVAMVLTACTGVEWTDSMVNSKFGFDLELALQTEDPAGNWRDMGNIEGRPYWDKIIAPRLLAGRPVIVGCNGPMFSPSGHGHIFPLTGLANGVVTFADPNGGHWRTCTVDDILNCPPHPQGKFVFAATPAK